VFTGSKSTAPGSSFVFNIIPVGRGRLTPYGAWGICRRRMQRCVRMSRTRVMSSDIGSSVHCTDLGSLSPRPDCEPIHSPLSSIAHIQAAAAWICPTPSISVRKTHQFHCASAISNVCWRLTPGASWECLHEAECAEAECALDRQRACAMCYLYATLTQQRAVYYANAPG
jgi:hypothetical protein